MNGVIVWYSEERRYGFVRPTDDGADLAFHMTDTMASDLGTVTPGMEVHFMVRHDGLGPLAHRLAPGHVDEGL